MRVVTCLASAATALLSVRRRRSRLRGAERATLTGDGGGRAAAALVRHGFSNGRAARTHRRPRDTRKRPAPKNRV